MRDVTPEATLKVATRNVPGISEAIRYESMKYTNRAMLSRGVSVLRNKTLIINLPGSLKAVKESLDIIIDLSPLYISLKTAIITIVITFFLGLFLAKWTLNRKHDLTKIILDGIFTMPLVLPPTVMGFFLLMIFGVNQPIGKLFLHVFHYKITFSFSATVIAAVVISFPLMYRSAKAAMEQIDHDLIDSGRTLGMSEKRIFFTVILPEAMPGIISGGVLSFARGLGEFGATAMLAGNIVGKTRTLPLAVYSEVMSGNYDNAGVYVFIIVVVCLIAVVGVNVYQYSIKKKRSF